MASESGGAGGGLPSLSDRTFEAFYSSDRHDIGQFYGDALECCSRYDRAVGYFRSSVLGIVGADLVRFAQRGGTTRLIASPNLTQTDHSAIVAGSAALDSRIKAALISGLEEPDPTNYTGLLSWLIANELLKVRIAVRIIATESGLRQGLFHEKVGVFHGEHDWVTFTGSPNETRSGLVTNAECFPVHRSWVPGERLHAELERAQFDDTWHSRRPQIEVWDYTEWLKDPMSATHPPRAPDNFPERAPTRILVPTTSVRAHRGKVVGEDAPVKAELAALANSRRRPFFPAWLRDGEELHDYQRDAISRWRRAQGRGVFAMATGTGKTITALSLTVPIASNDLITHDSSLLILVVVPNKDLVEQWAGEARSFGYRVGRWHSAVKQVGKQEVQQIIDATNRPGNVGVIVTTAQSLISDTFRRALARHDQPLMVIGDEMHSLGTQERLSGLPERAVFRLGLSATPHRHRDDEGTEALFAYFGDVVLSISIKEAIEVHKTLVPYDYFPKVIELSETEADKYRKISAEIAAAFASNDQEKFEQAVRRRTRLTSHAAGKIVELDRLLTGPLAGRNRQLVYVAEGENDGLNAMDEVVALMGLKHKMRVARYFGETAGADRLDLQDKLATGEMDALVAMKCLDEGVDIPEAEVGVIMASTQNPRQFVQRRGRLLRRSPGKAIAVIYDMLVLPPDHGPLSRSEETLVVNELRRAAELADAARNADAMNTLDQIWLRYSLPGTAAPEGLLAPDGSTS